jgi:hypothetical protein
MDTTNSSVRQTRISAPKLLSAAVAAAVCGSSSPLARLGSARSLLRASLRFLFAAGVCCCLLLLLLLLSAAVLVRLIPSLVASSHLQNRLYIGSLPLSMDRDAVEQDKQFGKVTNVWIAKNVRGRGRRKEKKRTKEAQLFVSFVSNLLCVVPSNQSCVRCSLLCLFSSVLCSPLVSVLWRWIPSTTPQLP